MIDPRARSRWICLFMTFVCALLAMFLGQDNWASLNILALAWLVLSFLIR